MVTDALDSLVKNDFEPAGSVIKYDTVAEEER